jgi:hypothetical protein
MPSNQRVAGITLYWILSVAPLASLAVERPQQTVPCVGVLDPAASVQATRRASAPPPADQAGRRVAAKLDARSGEPADCFLLENHSNPDCVQTAGNSR